MKLAPKLLVLLLLIAIAPATLVGYLGYSSSRRTILQETTDHLVSINLFKNHELQRWVEANKASIEELAQRPTVIKLSDMLARHEVLDVKYQAARQAIIEEHFRLRLKYGGFFELFIMCPEHGYISASTDDRQEGKHRKEHAYYLESRKHTVVQGVYYSQTLEQPVMTIGTPIANPKGDLIGILGGRQDLGELSRIITRASEESRSGDTYLVNAFNFFVTEPRSGKGYALKKAVRIDGVRAGLSGRDGVDSYMGYRGVPVIGAYKWLPEFKMCLITEIDQAEALAPVHRMA